MKLISKILLLCSISLIFSSGKDGGPNSGTTLPLGEDKDSSSETPALNFPYKTGVGTMLIIGFLLW